MKIKLNLIPPQKKEEIKKAYWLRLVSKWEIEFVFLLVFFIATLAIMNFILQINIATEDNNAHLTEENSAKYNAIKEYDNEIKDAAKQIANVKKIQDNQLYWSKLLKKIDDNVKTGIEITSLTTTEYSLVLSGKADTRDGLIALKDGLASDACFANVDLPLSNLVSKENVEFKIALKINKECLK